MPSNYVGTSRSHSNSEDKQRQASHSTVVGDETGTEIINTSANCGGRNLGKDVVEILLWSGGSVAGFETDDYYGTPNYLGHAIDKTPWNCPVDCRYTSDKTRVGNADGVIYEAQPITSYYDDYKWSPPSFPQKYTGQSWINHGYETQYYFHLYGDPGYMNYIDANFTFYLHSQVPITFTCLWGGGNNITDFLRPHPPKKKENCAVFMTTNCQSGGAVRRTEIARELMKHMEVHSYGKCLHNRDFPPEMQFPIYNNHGQSMANKIFIFEKYKFVFVFENNNVTDYVTEKMTNVLQAGSVPVYMGSENVHPYWTPGEHSIVQAKDFDSPESLAKYLTEVCNDDEKYEEYFAWKKKGLSKHFEQRFNDCVFYGAECRLCTYLHEQRKKLSQEQLEKVNDRRMKSHTYYSLKLNGKDQFISIDSKKLTFGNSFTFSTWINTNRLDNVVILDREGVLRVDLILLKSKQQAFVRLCVNDKECFTSSYAITISKWQHLVVLYHYEEGETGFVKFWINGQEDPTVEIPLVKIKDDSSKTLFVTTDHKKNRLLEREVDDISIWNIAVDSKQAKSMIYDVFAGFEKGLSAYWSFNNGDMKDVVSNIEAINKGAAQFVVSLSKPLITVHPFM